MIYLLSVLKTEWQDIWKFIENRQSLFIPLLVFFIYLLIYLFYILYEIFIYFHWKKNKKSEILKLEKICDDSEFIDIKTKIIEIKNEIKNISSLELKSEQNTLILSGNYGNGKTYIVSKLIKSFAYENDLINQKTKYKTYYLNVSKIENNSKINFGNYLFNEIVKCIKYKNYFLKLILLKFFLIFSKKLPFDLNNENYQIQYKKWKNKSNNKQKVIIFIDEIDRCERENILSVFSIIKSYFNKIKNVVLVISVNEDLVKAVLNAYYGHPKVTKIGNNHDIFYYDFISKIVVRRKEIDEFIKFNFLQHQYFKNNIFIKYNIKNFNFWLDKISKFKTINDVKIKINEIFKFNFLLNNKHNDKNEIIDIVSYFLLIQEFIGIALIEIDSNIIFKTIITGVNNNYSLFILENNKIIIKYFMKKSIEEDLTSNLIQDYKLKSKYQKLIKKLKPENITYFINDNEYNYNFLYFWLLKSLDNINFLFFPYITDKSLKANFEMYDKFVKLPENINYSIVLFDIETSKLIIKINDQNIKMNKIWDLLVQLINIDNDIIKKYNNEIHNLIMNLCKNINWKDSYKKMQQLIN